MLQADQTGSWACWGPVGTVSPAEVEPRRALLLWPLAVAGGPGAEEGPLPCGSIKDGRCQHPGVRETEDSRG